MRDPVTALGYLAGVFTTAAFIPQLVRASRSRSTKDLSLPIVLIFTTGVLLWLVYEAGPGSDGPKCLKDRQTFFGTDRGRPFEI